MSHSFAGINRVACTNLVIVLQPGILPADGVMLKLDNQKNGWKGVCVNHEANGVAYFCPVHAQGWRCIHIHGAGQSNDGATLLSAYFVKGTSFDFMDRNICDALKWAAKALT